jgi:SAM-dependent methyltransferase
MEKTKQLVREFYDDIGWKADQDGLFQNARFEDLRPVAREYIHKCHLRINRHIRSEGELVLDAGSGPVQWPEYLTYSRGYRYRVCADISMSALIEARKRLGDRGLFVVADIAHLPFKSDAFDALVSIHAVHHLPLPEHKTAFLEFHRVLSSDSTGVVVNGWYRPFLMRLVGPIISLGRLLDGRALKRKKNWSLDADPEVTFVQKMTPGLLRRQLGGRIPYQIFTWRSLSPRFMQWFIRPQTGGGAWLRLVYWLEERFPHFFGQNGQYPLIVISKAAVQSVGTVGGRVDES